jgi:phage baseplate assembly protein W
MAKPFLGIGAGFPLRLDSKTGVFLRAESILIILGTAKGERVMRPDFGCGIHDLVFQNLSAGTMGRVQQAVREALLRLEPRIDVIEVVVQRGEADNVLEIHIQYEVRATNNAFNLVYPFYLQQGLPA